MFKKAFCVADCGEREVWIRLILIDELIAAPTIIRDSAKEKKKRAFNACDNVKRKKIF